MAPYCVLLQLGTKHSRFSIAHLCRSYWLLYVHNRRCGVFTHHRRKMLLGSGLRPSHFVSGSPSRCWMGRSSYWQKLHGKRGQFAPISAQTMTYCSSLNSHSIAKVEPWLEFWTQGLSNDWFNFIVRHLENSRWYMANKTDRIFAILYWCSVSSVSTESNVIGHMRVKSNWSNV